MMSKSSHHHNNNTTNHNNNNNHGTKKSKQIANTPTTDQLVITKLDYEIAKHLRNNLPDKEAMFVGIKRVNYFVGSKAVDLLMESKYSKNFNSRHDVVIFLNDLLLKKFYHRARKIVRVDGAKKKFKLDMHDVQTFEDSNQPYVWLYEPTSIKAWLLCFGVIFGVIAICLFPLWPSIIRTWVYYLSVAAVIFLSSILSLIVLRIILFFTLWALTFGKLHLWILPNLTEDVGFFESFWPLYTMEKGASGFGVSTTEGTEGSGEADSPGGGGGDSHSHQD